MIDLTLEDLKQFLSDGRRAARYAWDHYEELTARKAAHTLYGPYEYYIGAAIPGTFIAKNARNLTLKTNRKQYLMYELDSEYNPLRTTHVINLVHDSAYEHFELDGIQYAYPFVCNKKKIERDEVIALSYKDGKPYYYAFLRKNVVYVDFYEYVSPEKVFVTEYCYNRVSEYSAHGYPTDFDAPVGALNSPASRVCWEEEPIYTDFSQWFRKAD